MKKQRGRGGGRCGRTYSGGGASCEASKREKGKEVLSESKGKSTEKIW